MRADARAIASGAALAATAAGIGYLVFATLRVLAFARAVERQRARTRTGDASVPRPTVTILKPVRGIEPMLAEDLASFCAQDYPAFDVVLGTLDPNDPARPVLDAVARAFPGRTTVVAGNGQARHRNPKMSTLAPMLPHATGEIVVIADSDMRVTPEYLDAVVAPFADPEVGAVTAIYCGRPAGQGIVQELGAMGITEQFVPSALVARAVEPMTYCFGGTMAVRRDVLDAIGGLDALGPHLADDAALGRLVASTGRRVELADFVIEAIVADESFADLFRHEVRWARTIRSVRPASYVGIAISYPVPLALIALALARTRRPALLALLGALIARIALHRAVRALDRRGPSRAALVPLRDALGLGVWCAGLFGRSVRWREQTLTTYP